MRSEEAREIVNMVESRLGIRFSRTEVTDTLFLTGRKMELNHQEDGYFPILFQNELEDLCTRKAINTFFQ